jgi:hypothetical protein
VVLVLIWVLKITPSSSSVLTNQQSYLPKWVGLPAQHHFLALKNNQLSFQLDQEKSELRQFSKPKLESKLEAELFWGTKPTLKGITQSPNVTFVG